MVIKEIGILLMLYFKLGKCRESASAGKAVPASGSTETRALVVWLDARLVQSAENDAMCYAHHVDREGRSGVFPTIFGVPGVAPSSDMGRSWRF